MADEERPTQAPDAPPSTTLASEPGDPGRIQTEPLIKSPNRDRGWETKDGDPGRLRTEMLTESDRGRRGA
jgi:hypothetical protein